MSCRKIGTEIMELVTLVVVFAMGLFVTSVLCGCSMTVSTDWIREGGSTVVESRNTKEDWSKQASSDLPPNQKAGWFWQ